MSILALLVVLVSCAAVDALDQHDWTVVEAKDELWRFQVGRHPDFVSIGTEYVCLFTAHDRFAGAELQHPNGATASMLSGGTLPKVHGSSQECTSTERFEVLFLDGGKGHVALRTNGGSTSMYVSCPNESDDSGVAPPAALAASIGENETFQIHINSAQDRIALFSSMHGKYLTVDDSHPHHVLSCGGDADRGRGEFRGWKAGKKEGWVAKEDLELVAMIDNCLARQGGSISLSLTVGVTNTHVPQYTVSDSFSVVPGDGLRGEFLESLAGNTERMVDWTRLSPDVFAKIVTDSNLDVLTISVDVGKEEKVWLYEVVGRMGPFTIRGRQFKTKYVGWGKGCTHITGGVVNSMSN